MKFNSLKNSEQGFSLVEVIASIVIIGIVLLSFSHFFINTNKTAVKNNEKLILMNLANAELERLKLVGYNATTTPTSAISDFNGYLVDITNVDCTTNNTLSLCDVKIEVKSNSTEAKYAVEGFVKNVPN